MKIELGKNWRIESDKLNYILRHRVEVDKSSPMAKKDTEKYKWVTEGYFSDLEHISSELIELEIRLSEADTLQKLIQYTTQLKKELTSKLVAS